MRAIRRPRPRTRFTGAIWPRARRACRSPSICRPRPATTATIRCARRSRQGRRADLPSRRHARAVRRHPAGRDEHLDDDQRARRLAARALCRGRRRAGRAARRAHRHDAERHHQGISVARDLHFPPGALAAADQGHDRLHDREMPKWNPINVCSYHLQEAGATPVQELAFALATADRRARCGAGVAAKCRRGEFPRSGRPHLLLRQCRRALHHRDLQDARLRRAVGRDHARRATASPIRSCACSATACR